MTDKRANDRRTSLSGTHTSRLAETEQNRTDCGQSSPFRIAPLLLEHCRDICEWRYEPPYDIYAWQPWELMASLQQEFGDPQLREEQYRAVLDAQGGLCGFAQFFPMAAVTRLGLGMRPDACGQGSGAEFVRAIAAEARRMKPEDEIDLEVLTWNKRAIRAYRRAGFVITDTYERMTPTGEAEFHCMVWSE
ncbi:Protein N-acetyltransferase, RimJ/RimL family [Paenibacillus sp. UNCCL117]|uniref:GNAT family N-acetyltransferase n=1 Tax=unclassified Paenibacillus TaxID=185978 RepID=UPI00088991AF|nr:MULTISPECIES: GNAT family protein [unclassified Paenibacillus]SDD16421.1 Protein N-acetyltransferase, RimJ/RimL family [Paenibacillus sp. cl123]SFW34702.1 Protein N-acetyltransferase, RimJ/RimL family [Paenibacillus sp. UNCCL117]